MYQCDIMSGDTIFSMPASATVKEVFLVGRRNGDIHRVKMAMEKKHWIARLALAPGWFFYRFEIDGRSRWDRSSGKVCAEDGQTCSLAVISGRLR